MVQLMGQSSNDQAWSINLRIANSEFCFPVCNCGCLCNKSFQSALWVWDPMSKNLGLFVPFRVVTKALVPLLPYLYITFMHIKLESPTKTVDLKYGINLSWWTFFGGCIVLDKMLKPFTMLCMTICQNQELFLEHVFDWGRWDQCAYQGVRPDMSARLNLKI
jgi:hypothetical protein